MIVVETKSGTLSSDAKYSNDPQKFDGAVNTKFVVEGLTQLSRSILRFASGDQLCDSTGSPVVAPDSIRKIIPALAHLEDSLRVPTMSQQMTRRFLDMETPAKIIVTSLLLLPITGLEEIVGYLGDTGLNVIIESFLSSHETDFLATFELGAIPVLRGRPRPANPVEDRFQRAWRA